MLDFTTSDCHVEHPRKHAGLVAHKFASQPSWLYVCEATYLQCMSYIAILSQIQAPVLFHVFWSPIKGLPLALHVYPKCATNGRAEQARHNCRAKRARLFSSFAFKQVVNHAFMHVQSQSELATATIRVGERRRYITQSSMQVKSKKHSWSDFSKWFAPLASQIETQTKSTCSPH
jgi:hypothetical protein